MKLFYLKKIERNDSILKNKINKSNESFFIYTIQIFHGSMIVSKKIIIIHLPLKNKIIHLNPFYK